jgi:hypothetical protein
MSLIRKASLPFSAITAVAHSSIRSNRSRLRRCVGARRARLAPPPFVGFSFVGFFVAMGFPMQLD